VRSNGTPRRPALLGEQKRDPAVLARIQLTPAAALDDEDPSRPAVVAAGSSRPVERRAAGWGRERLPRSRSLFYRARPALACIIGARRACTVEMISSEEIPCW
jgi:hypothetical protein